MKKFVIYFGITTVGSVIALGSALYDILFIKSELSGEAFAFLIMLIGYVVGNFMLLNWAWTCFRREKESV